MLRWLLRKLWHLIGGDLTWDAIGFFWGLLVPGGSSAVITAIVSSVSEELPIWLVIIIFLVVYAIFLKIILNFILAYKEEASPKESSPVSISTPTPPPTLSPNLEPRPQFADERRPRLKAEAEIIYRKITPSQQPKLPLRPPRVSFGCFVLLRVTNKPESTNSAAVARNLYAHVSYYDASGSRLFLPVAGTWVIPDHPRSTHYIDSITDRCPPLKPYDSIHLGIVLAYLENPPFEYGALNAASPQFLDWMHADLLLNNKVPLDAKSLVRIEVTLGCHGFRERLSYVLRFEPTEKRLSLEPIIPPTPEDS